MAIEGSVPSAKVIEDAKKVRRRVEDVLRKSSVKTIYDVAKFLGISTEIKPARRETHGN